MGCVQFGAVSVQTGFQNWNFDQKSSESFVIKGFIVHFSFERFPVSAQFGKIRCDLYLAISELMVQNARYVRAMDHEETRKKHQP